MRRYALCSANDPHLIKKTFDMLLDEVREQDVPHFFEGLQSNPKTRRALAEFFKLHYEEVRRRVIICIAPVHSDVPQIYARYKNNFCLKYLIEVRLSRI